IDALMAPLAPAASTDGGTSAYSIAYGDPPPKQPPEPGVIAVGGTGMQNSFDTGEIVTAEPPQPPAIPASDSPLQECRPARHRPGGPALQPPQGATSGGSLTQRLHELRKRQQRPDLAFERGMDRAPGGWHAPWSSGNAKARRKPGAHASLAAS